MSAFVFGIWLISSLPDTPKLPQSMAGWGVAIVVFVLILPVTFLLEFVAEWLGDNRLYRTVERKTEGRGISGLRILYGLLYFSAVGAVIIAVIAAWRAVFQ